MSPPVKIVVPTGKKKIVLGGDVKTSSPSSYIPKKLNAFCINITTRQQFFISVSDSTKNMLKLRLPYFFQIIFEIET